MTDRPVDEIRPGDRVYLSNGTARGTIVEVTERASGGASWRTTFGPYVFTLDKPLRILRPGDVIPAGAESAYVQPSGELQSAGVVVDGTRTVSGGHCVIFSMPTPEPSREEQREKLVDAYSRARVVFGEAIDALEKFDAENPS